MCNYAHLQLQAQWYVHVDAIKRYFESRKRLYRESKPNQKARVTQQEKQRKSRSRRQRVSQTVHLLY